MNSVHARAFLTAAASCDPSGDYSGPRALVDALAKAAPESEWHAAVSGGSASALRLGLLFCGDLTAARAAASSVLPVDADRLDFAPGAARPWLDAAWDAKNGTWTGVELARGGKNGDFVRVLSPEAGPEKKLIARKFSAADFEDPVASALKAFHALEPVAAVQTAAGRPDWTLKLARPVPWPRFLRCDVAGAFVPRAAQLTLLLRDARVVALDFDGEALWARFVG
jgi:hypothetical protein